MSHWINRKELSFALNLSVDRIRRHEKALGLDKAKRQLGRSVFYVRAQAMAAASGFAGTASTAPTASTA